MGQTAMYTPNPHTRGVSVRGKEYPVRDQIAVVDDDFIPALRSLGFIPAVQADVKPLEVSAAPAAPAKSDAPPAAKK